MSLMDTIAKWFNRVSHSRKMKLLEEQQQLLLHGFAAHAEVIAARSMGSSIGKLQLIQLWLKVEKPDGSFVYTHSKTLTDITAIPVKGTLLLIKYMPKDLKTVAIV